MADTCQREIAGLPILTGCISDTELIMVMNSTASGNLSGYGLRYAKDIRQCFLAGLNFVPLQFTIGQGGSLMSPGDTGFTLARANVIQDSVFITLDGVELPRNLGSEVSYTVTYSSTGFTVTLNQACRLGQDYIVHYAYSS